MFLKANSKTRGDETTIKYKNYKKKKRGLWICIHIFNINYEFPGPRFSDNTFWNINRTYKQLKWGMTTSIFLKKKDDRIISTPNYKIGFGQTSKTRVAIIFSLFLSKGWQRIQLKNILVTQRMSHPKKHHWLPMTKIFILLWKNVLWRISLPKVMH